jgi:hypothetical protein
MLAIMQRTTTLGMIAAALALAAAACGKKDEPTKHDDDGKPASSATKTTTPGEPTAPAVTKPPELPPPPQDVFEGKARLINVYRDGDGKPVTVDVWATASFTHGAVQLARGLELGQASDWFAVPSGQSVVVVEAGAGPGGTSLGGVWGPKNGDHVTAVLQWDGSGPTVGSYWETRAEPDEHVVAPPQAGHGVVQLRADQTWYQKSLDQTTGTSFLVGTGAAGECAPQRQEAAGKQGVPLGGTQAVSFEVPAGKATFSLHAWPGKCDSEPLLGIEVEVADGEGVLAYVFTRDGATVEAATTTLGIQR